VFDRNEFADADAGTGHECENCVVAFIESGGGDDSDGRRSEARRLGRFGARRSLELWSFYYRSLVRYLFKYGHGDTFT
jgi:hypothetical protein